MKGKALRKQSLQCNIAASVLLKLFKGATPLTPLAHEKNSNFKMLTAYNP